MLSNHYHLPSNKVSTLRQLHAVIFSSDWTHQHLPTKTVTISWKDLVRKVNQKQMTNTLLPPCERDYPNVTDRQTESKTKDQMSPKGHFLPDPYLCVVQRGAGELTT